ncbi:hypothetical protein UFOVP447_235 [uncultured Caudovirales phage]|uniref:Uncharacterized protein n=1 Tax=uncultured Caudovirales phage TaxID=2100421 RepID=A0A6J5MAR3_9CAUD|nr:hypothetical protein UFOVP447_235 [uncultured Caudovirales phage]
MSWNNVVPSSIIHRILDEIDKEPKQLHFDEELFAPCYTIKDEYLVSLNEAFSWISPTGHGPNGTVAHSVDHPAFAALRKHLDARGFIKIETGWVNGDRVTKPFYLNEVYFDVGDKFVCSSAMAGHLKFRKKYYD